MAKIAVSCAWARVVTVRNRMESMVIPLMMISRWVVGLEHCSSDNNVQGRIARIDCRTPALFGGAAKPFIGGNNYRYLASLLQI